MPFPALPINPASNLSDTRLLPNSYNKDKKKVEAHPDKSVYYFGEPANGTVTVTVKLWYRYAFKELAEQKNWTTEDILVRQESVEVQPP